MCVFDEISSHYEMPLSSAALITEEERKRVLEFAGTLTPYPSDKTISGLFEEQVDLYSGKIAVTYKDVSLTYDQLNRKSNQLVEGEKLYRTGDYGRWLEDGNIEFCGRIDNQVKVRVFRVELEGIEAIISGIEGVIEVVVKSFKIQDGDTRLMAFLNVRDSFEMGTREVMAILKEKMPSYMIPAYIRIMHGFPLTINGWSEVLKTKDILLDDDFFYLGGHSLIASQVSVKNFMSGYLLNQYSALLQ